MMIHDTAIPKLIALAVAGKAEEARRYVGHMLARGADLEPLREQVKRACAIEFVAPIMDALPWLAADRFEHQADNFGALRAALELAGVCGVPRSVVEKASVEGPTLVDEIVEFDQTTGGRPRRMVRLRQFDPRHNPYAMPS
jgi:hypothetical protein